MTAPVTMESVRGFLNVHRIVIAGASRNPQDYSRSVARELEQRGYEVLYLNPGVDAIDGKVSYSSVHAITPVPEGVILLVPEGRVLETAKECLNAGVRHLWFRHGEKTSEGYRAGIDAARAAGANVVSGECPLMFLPDVAWIHRAHRYLRQVTGTLPG
ncbi:MAG: CoA-binding protein [Bryobacterales bacterium]|nr:CoA-binding protein [Bryobacterales bacterium]